MGSAPAPPLPPGERDWSVLREGGGGSSDRGRSLERQPYGGSYDSPQHTHHRAASAGSGGGVGSSSSAGKERLISARVITPSGDTVPAPASFASAHGALARTDPTANMTPQEIAIMKQREAESQVRRPSSLHRL
jgi:hypothetical protein